MRIDAITKSDAEVVNVPHSGSYRNCAMRALRRMLGFAYEKQLISRIPRIPLAEENERTRTVKPQEEEIILARASSTVRDAYLLVVDLGIRPDDAARLPLPSVDFAANDVFISGGKTGRKGDRYIPMSDRVRAMLLRRAERSEKKGSPWFFPSSMRPGKHISIRASVISSPRSRRRLEWPPNSFSMPPVTPSQPT